MSMNTHPASVFRAALREEAERRAEARLRARARAVDVVTILAFGSLAWWLGYEIGRGVGP